MSLEARFERGMKTAGITAGPILGLLVYAADPAGQGPEARRLLAILVLTVAFWATEAIPLPATALLASSLCIVAGVAPAREVLAPYADPVIFLFVGTFLLAEAFKRYGLDQRVAARLLGRGEFARSRLGRLLGIGAASGVISCCISNTASAALMTPIAIGSCHEADEASPGIPDETPTDAAGRIGGATPPWVSGVLLMVAYGATIGGMATLIGTPPNLLVAGFLERLCGVRVGFIDWLLFGVPIALVLFVISIVWTRAALGKETGERGVSTSPDETGEGGREAPHGVTVEREPEPLLRTAGARWTMAAFGLAALLWTVPSLTALITGRSSDLALALRAHLPEAGVALFCATMLFLAPLHWRRRRYTLTWEDGRRVNWGIILLFGGGLSLGTLAQSTGVARWVGEGLETIGFARSGAGLLFCAIALSILVSEFASNTAATTLLVPMVIAAAEAAGLDPVRPVLGVGLAATCGFIFPVSTPPNAIVFGTGLVPLRRMIRAGILLDMTALVVVWVGLLLLTPILPR